MNLREFQQSEFASKPHLLLLGNPVGHSLSPRMHNMAAKYHGVNVRYYAVNVGGSELGRLASHMNSDAFIGANITIPYKQTLMNYVDQLDKISEEIGAVNTIVKNGFKLTGHNTDVDGFAAQLEPHADELEGSRAIVFGTGGASKAIAYALKKFGLEEIILISRNPDMVSGLDVHPQVSVGHYDAWPALAEEAILIVNATPLGMEPKTDTSPVRIKEEQYLSNKICYDIVYKPLKTRFIKQAESVGARTIGGLEMLIQQGNQAFKLWTGKSFPLDEIRNDLYEYCRD